MTITTDAVDALVLKSTIMRAIARRLAILAEINDLDLDIDACLAAIWDGTVMTDTRADGRGLIDEYAVSAMNWWVTNG